MPVQWYCRLMGAEMGPFTAAQLVEMARTHQLTPEDMVRRGPEGEWVAGYRVRGLFDDEARSRTVAATPPPATPKAAKPNVRATPAPAAAAAPQAAGDEVGWFYISHGAKYGPLSFGILQQRCRNGQLRPTDRVWSTLTPKWSQAENVDGLEFG
jgi:hypothetical protein